jgi:protein tyrosine phosphatase
VARWVLASLVAQNDVVQLKLAVAQQEKQQKRHGMEPGPMVLLCPTGVHRCGTFAALDIVCDRLAETKEHFVGLHDTVTALRGQRWGCVEHFEHYRKLSDLIISFAMGSGIVNKGAIVAPTRQAGGQRRLNYN